MNLSLDQGVAIVAAAIIAAIVSAFCTIWSVLKSKKTAEMFNEFKNQVNNEYHITNQAPSHPIEVNPSPVKILPSSPQPSTNYIISDAMDSIFKNLYLIYYNYDSSNVETEIIKASSTLFLRLDESGKDVKSYCESYCEQIHLGQNGDLRRYVKETLSDFCKLCHNYLANQELL